MFYKTTPFWGSHSPEKANTTPFWGPLSPQNPNMTPFWGTTFSPKPQHDTVLGTTFLPKPNTMPFYINKFPTKFPDRPILSLFLGFLFVHKFNINKWVGSFKTNSLFTYIKKMGLLGQLVIGFSGLMGLGFIYNLYH